ncbi:hypothetical protein Dimus_005255 [Dionaea muscipula]
MAINTSPMTPSETGLSRFPSLHHLPSSNPQNLFSDLNPITNTKTSRFRSTCTSSKPEALPTSFPFHDLAQVFQVKVERAEARSLNVPLIAPFTIASSRLDRVENVAIRVELTDGSVGWGEAPILPSVTAEDQPLALGKATAACELLRVWPSMNLGFVLGEMSALLPGHELASVRAGMEMAIIDAVAHSICVPLWRLFGGVSDTITSDITIPIVSADSAAKLASKYRKQGFKTLKLKVGKNLNADIQVLEAIRLVYPDCKFILDANEGYTANEALDVLQILKDVGITPVLFEQPVCKDNWEGLGHVTRVAKDKFGVAVAADESCRCISDAERIAEENLAHVINVKLAKFGVVGALEIIETAIASGLNLMIGGMVETRLAMGFAGHLAAGMGCFRYIDLDTPLLLSEDPVFGGYEVAGAVYKFSNSRGHGGFLRWDNMK